jgi:hypothetical protein
MQTAGFKKEWYNNMRWRKSIQARADYLSIKQKLDSDTAYRVAELEAKLS